MAGLDTPELEALRDELVRMRGRGIRSTLYDGKRLEYGTDAELAAAINDLEARIPPPTAQGGVHHQQGSVKCRASRSLPVKRGRPASLT